MKHQISKYNTAKDQTCTYTQCDKTKTTTENYKSTNLPKPVKQNNLLLKKKKKPSPYVLCRKSDHTNSNNSWAESCNILLSFSSVWVNRSCNREKWKINSNTMKVHHIACNPNVCSQHQFKLFLGRCLFATSIRNVCRLG